MPTIRQARLVGLVRTEIVALVEQELQDPALETVRVRGVELSRDRRIIRVKVTHDDEAVSEENVLQALRRSRGWCRRELAERQVMQRVPDLRFDYDRDARSARRVLDLLDSLDLDHADDDA
ncbi:MAG: 30S ribosome-binding factor RbfA [Caldilineaceae bacterium]|nr:30S ribosome-binding factor RbfA [Caldilineaceae bacterium]